MHLPYQVYTCTWMQWALSFLAWLSMFWSENLGGLLYRLSGCFTYRLRTEAALSAPTKKLSEKKSQKKKKAEKAAAAAAAALAASTAAPGTGAAVAMPEPATAASAEMEKGTGACCEAPLLDQMQKQKKQQQVGQKQQQNNQQVEEQGPQEMQQPAGVRFVSLGLSPFNQLKDGEMKHSKAVARLLTITFERGNTFYPFKTIAASKAKYGAGLHDGVYEDPNVNYRMTYFCHSHSKVASLTLFDLGVFVGFWSNPPDALLIMARSKVNEVRMRRAKQRAAKKQQEELSARVGTSSTAPSTLLSACSTTPSTLLSACSTAPSLLTQASEKVELDDSDKASSSSGSSSQEPVKIRLVVPKVKGMELSESEDKAEAKTKGSEGKCSTGINVRTTLNDESLRAMMAA
jgi:hypothetical protein